MTWETAKPCAAISICHLQTRSSRLRRRQSLYCRYSDLSGGKSVRKVFDDALESARIKAELEVQAAVAAAAKGASIEVLDIS